MLILVFTGLLISIASHVACSEIGYKDFSEIEGSLKLYEKPATWEQAVLQCRKDGAVLASPLTSSLRSAMQDMMKIAGNCSSYFIVANSTFISSGKYVSIEGVSLRDMPFFALYENLLDRLNVEQRDPQKKECLSMNFVQMNEESCLKNLPYMCYRKLTKCGTTDKEYRFERSTGSCYKVHRNVVSWVHANTTCVSEGGYLAIVNNETEAKLLTTMIPDIRMSWSYDNGHEGMFIGLLDWTGNGAWLTGRGEALNDLYHSWDEGQPDGGVQPYGVINRRGKLDNVPLHYHAPFVCEKDVKKHCYPQDFNATERKMVR